MTKKCIQLREILKRIIKCGIALIILSLPLLYLLINKNTQTLSLRMVKQDAYSSTPLKEAYYYTKLAEGKVRCKLCPRECVIASGKRGFCQVRENQKGKLYALTYSRPCAISIDPIEKAPLYHFKPSHKRLTIATVGCNLKCKHCQNWYISQAKPKEVIEYNLSAEDVVKEAQRHNVDSISFTYTEPTIFYEYMYDICKLAKKAGLMTSIVSNGFINPEPLKEILPYLTAVKIDLKAFTDEFYRQICLASLKPVLTTLKVLKKEGAYFEIVNLIIPTLNDNLQDIKKMCEWIKDNLGDEVPLHFTRFSPAYKMTHLPPTPLETLEMAVNIAHKVGLKYVYVGNVPGHKYNSTFCPKCKKRIIHRIHFEVLENYVVDGACKFCKYRIPGIW